MNNLTRVCAGLALISAIVTATLWRELRAERELVAGLQAQLVESSGSATLAPASRIDAGTVPVAAPVATIVQQDKPAAAPAPVSRPPSPAAIQNAVITEQELLKDPDYRKARAAMMRAGIEQSYPGLVEELGLGKEDTERFLDLMAEHQMAMTSQLRPMTPDMQRDQAAMQQMMSEQQALRRQQEDSIRVMLGDARYAKWQEYQPTRSARMQASSYANTLAQAGLPLDNAQLKSVAAAVIAEQKSMQQDIRALASSANAGDPQSQARVQEAFRNRQAESNRRILEAAAGHLNAQQLSALRTQFEQQDAINRASIRASEIAAGRQPPQ